MGNENSKHLNQHKINLTEDNRIKLKYLRLYTHLCIQMHMYHQHGYTWYKKIFSTNYMKLTDQLIENILCRLIGRQLHFGSDVCQSLIHFRPKYGSFFSMKLFFRLSLLTETWFLAVIHILDHRYFSICKWEHRSYDFNSLHTRIKVRQLIFVWIRFVFNRRSTWWRHQMETFSA